MQIVVVVRQPMLAGRPARLDDADEIAVDQARRIALCRRDVEVTALAPGPAAAAATVRRALALGADVGVHVHDARLPGGDALAISRVLATAVQRVGFDLVLCGCAPADAAWAMVPAMLAERLGVPSLCFAHTLRVGSRTVEISRPEVYQAVLPAVVSVTERCGEPRYRRFSAAARQPVRTWSLADLGLDDDSLAEATTVVAATPMPRRTGTVIQGDPATAAGRVADFLAERQFL
jgi:electron transfer flavoprotein beta subunit